jgi:hypothetical protein
MAPPAGMQLFSTTGVIVALVPLPIFYIYFSDI